MAGRKEIKERAEIKKKLRKKKTQFVTILVIH